MKKAFKILGILIVLIVMVFGFYRLVWLPYNLGGAPEIVSNSNDFIDPSKIKNKIYPSSGLSYQPAIVKDKKDGYIYVRYVDVESDMSGKNIKEIGDIVKLKVTKNTYIWNHTTEKDIKIGLDKLPKNAYVMINDKTDNSNIVKYIRWSSVLEKDKKPFGGKIEELKSGLEINALVKDGKALAVQFKE